MTQQAFAAAALSWHDFFLAAAGATAALLGLLFVGVSINLAALAAEERVDLRARAGQAFANLTFVLVIALIMLIPDPDAQLMGISLGLVAGLGLYRVAQNVASVVKGWRLFRNKRTTARRIAWTVIADLILASVAWRIWADADATAIGNLIAVVLVLLIGAADIAWEMLVQVSRERAGDG
jgi:hypothetical protein